MFLGMIGRVLGALSIFSLLSESSVIGISDSLAHLVNLYKKLVTLLTAWADPVVQAASQALSDVLQVDISLAQEWRYLFFVMMLLFIRDAGVAYSDGRMGLAVVRLVFGGITAIITSLAFQTGGVDLDNNIRLSIAPVIGLLCYDVAMYIINSMLPEDQIGRSEFPRKYPQGGFLLRGFVRSLARFFLVLFASLSVFAFPAVRDMNYPDAAIVAISFGVIANALYWLGRALTYGLSQRGAQPFFSRVEESEAGRFAMALIGVIFWLTAFLGINSGMQLLGF